VLTPGSRGMLTPGWASLPGWAKGWERVDAMRPKITELMANHPELARLGGPPGSAEAVADPVPATVSEAVEKWYGIHTRHPERLIIRWTEREAIAKGFVAVEPARRSALAALFLGKTVHVPQREWIAASEPAFSRLLLGWRAFQTGEAELSELLEEEISAGMSA